MPTNSDFLNAIPTGVSPLHKNILRNALVRRTIYVFAPTDNPSDFVATTEGVVTLAVSFNRRIFFYDPADTTTAGDNVSVIVSSDGKRYKTDDLTVPLSVISADQTTPPGSPAQGAAYLTSAAPTGAWAGHPKSMAIYTSRGWLFVSMRIGQFIYVETGDYYLHMDSTGALVTGLGSQINSPASVPFSAAIAFGMVFSVENLTTNAPPSAAKGASYIIGPSPEGAWAGHAGKLAIRETGGVSDVYQIYSPLKGWRAHDKSIGSDVQFDGTTWVPASGAIRSRVFYYTSNGTFTKHANSTEVEVWCIGSGTSQSNGANTGGSATFGSFVNATGGVFNGAFGYTAGQGTQGTIQLNGSAVAPGGGGSLPYTNMAGFVPSAGPYGNRGSGHVNNVGGGASGGAAFRIIDSSLLNTTESVSVGSGGAGNGCVVVIERYRS